MAVLNVAVDLHNTVGSGKEFQSEMVRGKKEFLNMSLLQLYTLIDLEFLFLDGRGLNAIWGSVGIATRPLMIISFAPWSTGTTLHGDFPKFFPKSLHFSIDFPSQSITKW